MEAKANTHYGRIGIGIGLAVSFGSYIWPDPWPPLKWAGFAAGILIFLWGLGVAQRIRKMGPATIIAVGLSVAFVGIAIAGIGSLRLLQKKSTVENAFDGTLESLMGDASSGASSVPQRKYTAYDLGQRLKTADDLLEMMRVDFEPLLGEGNELFARVRSGVDSGDQNLEKFAPLDAELLAFAERYESVTKKWWEAIADSKYQEFHDMMNASNKTWDISKPAATARDLAGELVRLRNSHPLNIASYLENNRFLFAFKDAMKDHGLWIQNFGNALKKKRFEYSNAEPA